MIVSYCIIMYIYIFGIIKQNLLKLCNDWCIENIKNTEIKHDELSFNNPFFLHILLTYQKHLNNLTTKWDMEKL